MIELDTKEQTKNELKDGIEEIFKDEKLNELLKEKLNTAESLNFNFKLDENNELIATISNNLSDTKSQLTSVLANDNVNKIIKERLNNCDNINVTLSLNDDKTLSASINENITDEKTLKKEGTFKKIIKAFCNVCEDTFDEITKCFLKKKYKLNNSVYNDSKDAIKSLIKKDAKNVIKKSADAILRSNKS